MPSVPFPLLQLPFDALRQWWMVDRLGIAILFTCEMNTRKLDSYGEIGRSNFGNNVSCVGKRFLEEESG